MIINESKLKSKLLEVDKYDSIINSLDSDLNSLYVDLSIKIDDEYTTLPLTNSDILYIVECKRMETMKEIYSLNNNS